MVGNPAKNYDNRTAVLDFERTSAAPHTAQSEPPLMLPPRKCAEALGLPEYTIRMWLREGFIRGIPCGRKTLINVELLRRKLEEI